MKFTQLMSLLLVFLFLLTDARGYSQSLLDKKISLQTSQEDIKKVLSRIEEQADVHFAYSPQNVGNDKLYLNYQDQSLSVILNQIFKQQNISYQVQGSSIILYKNEERQNIVVKGRVADASNNPLNGVSVSVKSSTAGTSTNLHGSFSLSVPDENAILVFSYVGYAPEEVPLQGRKVINVTLNSLTASIGEVVVVGYGTQKKSVVTGAISSVKAADLENQFIGSNGQLEIQRGKIVTTPATGKVTNCLK